MKKIILILVFAIPVLAQTQEPVFIKEYKPQINLSLIGGVQNNRNLEASVIVYRIEISMQCPLINTKINYIRQQFSIIRQEGKKLKTVS